MNLSGLRREKNNSTKSLRMCKQRIWNGKRGELNYTNIIKTNYSKDWHKNISRVLKKRNLRNG